MDIPQVNSDNFLTLYDRAMREKRGDSNKALIESLVRYVEEGGVLPPNFPQEETLSVLRSVISGDKCSFHFRIQVPFEDEEEIRRKLENYEAGPKFHLDEEYEDKK